jgi:hypothetical protein
MLDGVNVHRCTVLRLHVIQFLQDSISFTISAPTRAFRSACFWRFAFHCVALSFTTFVSTILPPLGTH